jgi:hypothetical protein
MALGGAFGFVEFKSHAIDCFFELQILLLLDFEVRLGLTSD